MSSRMASGLDAFNASLGFEMLSNIRDEYLRSCLQVIPQELFEGNASAWRETILPMVFDKRKGSAQLRLPMYRVAPEEVIDLLSQLADAFRAMDIVCRHDHTARELQESANDHAYHITVRFRLLDGEREPHVEGTFNY